MALFQWSTFSVDDESGAAGGKPIPMEKPCHWNDQDRETKLMTITPAEVHPNLFKGQGQIHIHVRGKVQDIPLDKMPTLTAGHGAPNCASTSQMARNHHPRNQDEHHLATAADSSQQGVTWDFEVKWFCDLARRQREREGNAGFGFTFEQPKTKCAREHLHIKNMEAPINNGGEGAQRGEVDICQLGSFCMKPTDVWHSQLPGVERELHRADGSPRYKCPAPRGRGPNKAASWHKHGPVRGKTDQSVSYHKNLVSKLASGVHESFPI